MGFFIAEERAIFQTRRLQLLSRDARAFLCDARLPVWKLPTGRALATLFDRPRSASDSDDIFGCVMASPPAALVHVLRPSAEEREAIQIGFI